MFETLSRVPDDPILGMAAVLAADPSPRKIDLTVGVYKDENGRVPILRAVLEAQRVAIQKQPSKAYVGIAGDTEFNRVMAELMYGQRLAVDLAGRMRTAQTPGGCAALYAAAMLIREIKPNAVVWIGDPTWANHVPIFASAGLKVSRYPYYDKAGHTVLMDRMLEAIESAKPGDVILLHACCHNPSGADLSREQWVDVLALAGRKGVIPLIDSAYQGFGDSLDEDAFGIRHAAASVPELIVAASCSKNFGLYRDRVGAISIIGQNAAATEAAFSHVLRIARCSYSMPPAHGAEVVRELYCDSALRKLWISELHAMRTRITAMRHALVTALARLGKANGDYLIGQKGMFSFLDLPVEQIARLRKEFGIYILDSGRLNVCGLTPHNIDSVAQAIVAVNSGR